MPTPTPTGTSGTAGVVVLAPVVTDTSTLPPAVTGAAARAGSGLLSVWVPLGCGGLTAAVLALWCFRALRRRRRGLPPPAHAIMRTGAAATASLLLAVVTVAAGVNVYAGYLPTLSSAARFITGDRSARVTNNNTTAAALAAAGSGGCGSGRDRGWQLHDTRLPADPGLRIARRQVIVATPPGYDSCHRDYPTLYVFPGSPGKANDWFETGHVTSIIDALVAQHLSPFYVVVAPDVNGGYLADSETLDAAGGSHVETWVTRDVVHAVELNYRVRKDRADRVLAGMSSGGFAAVNLLFRHQDEFSIGLGMEPYGDPGNVSDRLLAGDIGLLHANSPNYYVPYLPLHRRLAVYLDVGTGTGEVPALRNLAQEIAQRHEAVTFRLENGQKHSWTEATRGLPYALAFAAQHLDQPGLRATLPVSAFPTSHRTAQSLILSQDFGASRARHFHCVLLRRLAPLAAHPVTLPRYCLPRSPRPEQTPRPTVLPGRRSGGAPTPVGHASP